jgi:hypothetical protein
MIEAIKKLNVQLIAILVVTAISTFSPWLVFFIADPIV